MNYWNKETNWVPGPEGTFSLYIRCYWGEEAIFDGSWKPPINRKGEVAYSGLAVLAELPVL